MEQTVEVVGMKAFRGTIDGKSIDSATLYVLVKLDARHNEPGKNFKGGEAIETWSMPDAESVFRMQHLPYPFLARLETERVSNGTDSKEVVMGAIPIERPAVVARPAFMGAVAGEHAAPVARAQKAA